MSTSSSFSLLNTDHVYLDSRWHYKNVISPFYRLYLIDDGVGILSNPYQTITLRKGYLYLIPSFTIVNQICDSYLSQYYIHFIEDSQNGSSLFAGNRKLLEIAATDIDFELFKRLITLNPGRDLRKSDNPSVYEKSPILTSFKALNEVSPLANLIETQGIILQLLSKFLSPTLFQTATSTNISSKVLEAINHIETKLASTITVNTLAERANQSPDYFSRLFCQNTGVRPLQYIQQKRIERAQFLILSSNATLASIATETGFESISYFNRIFKRVTGVTPIAYRNNQVHFV